MDILPIISAQRASLDLPLFAITLSAAPRPRSPVLLNLHWQGSRPGAIRSLADRPKLAPPCPVLPDADRVPRVVDLLGRAGHLIIAGTA